MKIHPDTDVFRDSFVRLMEYLIRRDFRGYEYDDLLASPFVNFLTSWHLFARIAAVQAAKRVPVNFRKILGVPKLNSTKASGFIVKGILHYYLATGDKKYNTYMDELLGRLERNASPGYNGMCWGNDFDFASRAGFFPKGLPTVVWTSHIQEAFDLVFREFPREDYRETVIRAGEFVLQDLKGIEDGTGICLAYSPGIPAPIHNSNLLGAVALLRAWNHSRKQEYLDKAGRAISWSVSRINPDGSWFYGDIPMMHWIDNYHTGYNLDCLCKANEICPGMVDPSVIRKTYEFWRTNFFTRDRIPKFYHNRLYPVDIQACAQAVESAARYSVYDPESLATAHQATEWIIRNMQKKKGAFRYRKYMLFGYANPLEPIHWGQATMLSALGYLLYYSGLPGRNIQMP
jgi:hypothetical protein